MSAIADAKRAHEAAILQRRVTALDAEIARGTVTSSGYADPYLAGRQEVLRSERQRYADKVQEIESLSGKALEDRYCPAPPEDAEQVTLHDVVRRGESIAGREVIRERTPWPVTHVGPPAAANAGSTGFPGQLQPDV